MKFRKSPCNPRASIEKDRVNEFTAGNTEAQGFFITSKKENFLGCAVPTSLVLTSIATIFRACVTYLSGLYSSH